MGRLKNYDQKMYRNKDCATGIRGNWLSRKLLPQLPWKLVARVAVHPLHCGTRKLDVLEHGWSIYFLTSSVLGSKFDGHNRFPVFIVTGNETRPTYHWNQVYILKSKSSLEFQGIRLLLSSIGRWEETLIFADVIPKRRGQLCRGISF